MTAIEMSTIPRLSRTRGPETRAAEIVIEHALDGAYRFAPALGWVAWDGRRWRIGESAAGQAWHAVKTFADETEKAYRARADLALVTVERIVAQIIAARRGIDEAAAMEEVVKMGAEAAGAQLASGTEAQQAEAEAAEDERQVALDQADIWQAHLSRNGITNLLAIAERDPRVLTETTAFDRDPDLLNVANGTVDLRTGTLMTHDPAQLITKITEVEFRADATHPAWDSARQAIAPGVEPWLRTRFGQSATGYRADDDSLVLNVGGGGNGKSTVMGAVLSALGEYALVVDHRALIASQEQHSTEKMDFLGARLAVLEELPEAGVLDEHRLKTTVGTPTMSARRIRRDPVKFKTTHTLWINSNYLPQVTGSDEGVWRRLIAVPWLMRFRKPGVTLEGPNDRPGDPGVIRALVDQPDPEAMAAVLAWVVAGAADWYTAGQRMPGRPLAVDKATERWRETSDPALRFVRDRLVADEHAFILAPEMLAAVNESLAANGRKPWGGETLNVRLAAALAQEGISATDPTRVTKVRDGDRQSTRQAYGAEPVAKGAVKRMWRGVRFRAAGEAAGVEGETRPALRALPTP